MRHVIQVFSLFCISLCVVFASFAASDPAASQDPPDAANQKDGQTPSATALTAAASSQPVEIEGAKDGKIEITMDTPLRRHFPVRVKTKDSMELKACPFPLRKDGETITAQVLSAVDCSSEWKEKQPVVSEKADSTGISFKPGEERRLELCLAENLSKGTYNGLLVFLDSNGKHVQEFDVTIKNPYITVNGFSLFEPNRYPTEYVFLLVLLGAVASLFLTKFPPLSSTRRANREKIMGLRERIRRLTAFERELGVKLTVELVKAETLNTNTKVYTPSAAERFKTIDALLETLDKYLDIRQEISKLYVAIDNADYLPFSMEQQVRTLLREADQGLYMDRPDLARARRKEAEKLLDCDPSVIKKQAEDLIKKLAEFLKELRETPLEDAGLAMLCKGVVREIEGITGADPEHHDEPCGMLSSSVMEKLKSSFGDEQELADEEKKGEFLRRAGGLDLAFNKAYIYHSYLLSKQHAGLQGEELHSVEAEIGKLIHSDVYRDLEEAKLLIRSLGMGVTEKRIKTALSKKEFSVVKFPSDPTVNNLVKFKILFKEDAINRSPLLKTSRFRYIWDFGDNTARAEGDEVIHYFKRRGILILFRKWVCRTLIVLKLRKVEWKSFHLSFEALGSDGTGLESKKQEVSVREALDRAYSSGITITALMGFALTLFISSAMAMTTNYEETYSFKSLQDILAPFLLGFGLDISRDRLQEAVKGYVEKRTAGKS